MKTIKIRNNYRGKFNLLSSEETLSFIMDICEDNETIEINGIKARLQLNEDLEPFDSPEDSIGEIYNKCYEYALHIWSTTDYKAQCLVFAKVFHENYKELCENRIQKQKESITKQIEELKTKLTHLYGYDDISYEVNTVLDDRIDMIKRWIVSNDDEVKQLKKNTEKYNKLLDRNKKHKEEIKHLEESKIQECYYETI